MVYSRFWRCVYFTVMMKSGIQIVNSGNVRWFHDLGELCCIFPSIVRILSKPLLILFVERIGCSSLIFCRIFSWSICRSRLASSDRRSCFRFAAAWASIRRLFDRTGRDGEILAASLNECDLLGRVWSRRMSLCMLDSDEFTKNGLFCYNSPLSTSLSSSLVDWISW